VAAFLANGTGPELRPEVPVRRRSWAAVAENFNSTRAIAPPGGRVCGTWGLSMRFQNLLLSSAALLLASGSALGQSTGTQDLETVVVTGEKSSSNGLMNAHTDGSILELTA